MIIRFRQSIAGERCSFIAGQRLTVKSLPRGWDGWLDNGIIEILADSTDECAVAPQEPERAVRGSRRGRSRRKTVA